MTAKELREKYLEFFKERGHAVLPSASLIPENDPTVLFTTAGMHPLVPFLLGEKHPAGKRLVSVQKCIRTGDIDEVGDNWHLTFFEMLGNWSLGDYFKDEAIKMSWEFLTDKLGLDKKNLAVSVFAGDTDAPFDEEAYKIWRELGVAEERIARLPKEDNWWGPAGTTGPCGPDTEMFFWAGEGNAPEKFDPQNKNWVEIWNDVFMQYNKTADGKFEPLKQRNVDTGMGMERMTAVLEGKDNIYETELFVPIIRKIESIQKNKKNLLEEEGEDADWVVRPHIPKYYIYLRVIADHLRAATFLIADGVVPSNKERGYILRRLIRKSVVYGKKLGIDHNFTAEIAAIVIGEYKDIYNELNEYKEKIVDELEKEEMKFGKTLDKGLKEFERLVRIGKHKEKTSFAVNMSHRDLSKVSEYTINAISPKDAFDLYQTYGFPLELINDLLAEELFFVDPKEFYLEFKKHEERHKELSRTASAGQFKGGLADSSDETKRLHTAAHLMLAALRKVLGEHVEQRGSNITAERLRFDFSHPKKMTPEEIKKVEDLVNEQIGASIPVVCEVASVDEAKKKGAMGIFGSKYGEKVKVYSVGDFSKEICGGPHVDNTGELGHFKIIKEEASSAGIRRIKAVLE